MFIATAANAVGQFAVDAGAIVLGGLVAVIAWKTITGQISLDGLFNQKRGRSVQGMSPSRIQLVTTTLITATYYLTQLIHDPMRFPVIPTAWLVGLGASHTIYLGGKVGSIFLPSAKSNERKK